MRKLIVVNITSLDGRYEGPGGNVMDLPFDPAFDTYNLERLRAADTLLNGRNTFLGFQEFWPRLADDPAVPETERAIFRRLNEIDKIVVSDGLTKDDLVAWPETRIVPRDEAVAEVRALKAAPGGDILMFGSRVLWNALVVAGAVDEIHIMTGSGLVGGGHSIYESDTPVSLRLLEARRLGDSELVLTRHAPVR